MTSTASGNSTSPPPPARRLRRAVNASLCVLAAAVVFMQAFPGFLFPHVTEYGDMDVHSVTPLPPETGAMLDRVRGRLVTSDITTPGTRYRVFLCDGTWRYPLLAPTSRRSFAVTNLFGNVFVARADVARDRAYADRADHQERSLTGVLAHELTHANLRRAFGVVAHHFLLPEWKVEGYCDHISGEGSMTREEGFALLLAGAEDASPAFRYFKFRLMVEHLLTREGWTVHDLMRREADPAALLARAVCATDPCRVP